MVFSGLILKAALSGGLDVVIKYWKPILVAVLVIGNIIQWEYYWPNKVEHWKDKYNNEHAALTACSESRVELQASIDLSNKQIDKWAKVSEKRQQSIEKLVSELVQMKDKTNKEVTEILNSPTPKSCDAAFQLLRDAIGTDLKWQK